MLYVISSVTLKLTNESNMHSKNLQKVTLKSSRPYNSFGWKFGFFSGKKYLMLLLSLRQLEEKSLWKISNCWKYFMLWRGFFVFFFFTENGAIRNQKYGTKCKMCLPQWPFISKLPNAKNRKKWEILFAISLICLCFVWFTEPLALRIWNLENILMQLTWRHHF